MQLKNMGAVLAGDLSGAKARLLQMVMLGFASDPADARARIQAAL